MAVTALLEETPKDVQVWPVTAETAETAAKEETAERLIRDAQILFPK
jgi:hypothetical protein